LELWFRAGRVPSFEILFEIYNNDEEPEMRPRVTLQHFYRHLDRDLHQWRHWEAFINGFHPRLFRLAGVTREALCDSAEQFPIFFNRLMEIREQRTISGVTRGEKDLIESPTRVRKRQESILRKLDQFTESHQSRRDTSDAKLRRLFPELSELPERDS
jgi:hypothetical protein